MLIDREYLISVIKNELQYLENKIKWCEETYDHNSTVHLQGGGARTDLNGH